MTNTDKTVAERLAVADALEEFAMIDECEGGNPLVIATESRAAELLREASRTQEPAGWHDVVKKVAYELMMHKELRITLGQMAFVEEAVSTALRTASITPPAPERSKEEVFEAVRAAFTRGTEWMTENPAQYSFIAKAAYDYADKTVSALEPASLHKGEAFGTAWQTSHTGDEWHFAREASFSPSDLERGIVKNVTPLYASPAPLPVGVTPDPAFLHGVCDSLRAAISEYEDRGLYPGARKIMQAQIDTLTAALSKPGEQG